MCSLVILMIETEQAEGLSARKLVVESAKHNVLTAYNAADGRELLRRFPAVDLVLVHALLPHFEQAVDNVLSASPKMPIVVASPAADRSYRGATYVVDSHLPAALLQLLAEHFGASMEN